MGKLADALAGLGARLAPRLAPLAARRETLLPLLAAALVLGVVGAALLLSGPSPLGESREVPIEGLQADEGLAALDADQDRLSDLEELVAGTSPSKNDTDGDGLPDHWEVRNAFLHPLSNAYCPDPLVADADRDCDLDTLSSREEMEAGTNPGVADVDGDGLPDGLEVRGGSDPFVADADEDEDGDGLTTLAEFRNGTRADRLDSDLDGLSDPDELGITKTNPARLSTSGSGLADGWLQAFTFPLDDAAVGFQDPDGDGLTNLEEFLFTQALAAAEGKRNNKTLQARELLVLYGRGLDPADADTDGDGMGDGYEVRFALDPLDDGRADPRLGPKGDPDGDSLLNEFEATAGSNPFLPDSDGEGLSDFEEVTTGWVVVLGDEVRNVTSDPSRADSDGDGLNDLEEKGGKATRSGAELNFPPLDPRSPDTDLDGLGDLDEITLPITSSVDPRRLDPTNPDTDADTLLDGDEFRFWSQRREGSGAEFEEALERLVRQMGEACERGISREEALNGLAPGGDLDCDNRPNLLDKDGDGDSLDDGKEIVPEDKAISEASRVRRPLPATDPALVDSDGEGLPDPWEHQYAQYDFGLGDWNLNASRKDSLRKNDGKTDADRDLDGDGVAYNGTGYARRVSHVHSNLFEFLSGTHPNLLDTDGDGLSDGWETYFSCITATSPRRGCGPLLPMPELVQVVVDVDPSQKDLDRDGTPDANETGERTPYTRFHTQPTVPPAPRLDGNASERFKDCLNAPGAADCDLFSGGLGVIVRIHGNRTLTYGVEHAKSLDPSVLDTDGDTMADSFEVAAGLNPLDAGDAAGDLDADGLTNLLEWEKGTDPRLADTDLGQLEDGKDADPLYPPDDAPEGDTDCDGVQNKNEGPQGSSLADFDSDNDGLLDGPGIAFFSTTQTDVVVVESVLAREGCTATAAQLQERFRDRGIAQKVDGTKVLFLGEHLYENVFANKADSDGDLIPDGWEAFWTEAHGLRTAKDPGDPGFFADGDSLNNTAEYRSGMPPGWESGGCGVWWLGTDPRSSDSDGDGVRDGTVLAGERLGGADADFDVDNDGLDDFTGEDPVPLASQANGAAVPLQPCDAYARFVEGWIFKAGRIASAAAESQPGVKVNQDYAKVKLVDLSAQLDPDGLLPADEQGNTLVKGGRFLVHGKVRVDAPGSPDNNKAVAGAVVLVNLGSKSGAPEDVLGVATTGSNGAFTVEGALRKERNTTLGADAVLFGARRAAGSEVSWDPDTSRFPPDAGYKLTVWTTARQSGPDGPYGIQLTKPSGSGTFPAKGILGTNVTSASGGALNLPLLTLKSGSALDLGARTDVTAGRTLELQGQATDALGDPLPSGVLANKLRITFLGTTYSGAPAVQVRDGGFTLEVPVSADVPLGPHGLSATYLGEFGLITGSTDNVTVDVRYPTNITGRVLNPGLVAVAGEPLQVEGEVRDFKGAPLPPGLTVAVNLPGSSVEGTTTAGGRYRVQAVVPVTSSVGTQSVEVELKDSASYEGSSADAGFVTLVQQTDLTLRGQRSPVGRDLVITGTLADLAGNPVDDPTLDGNTTLRVSTPVLTGEANLTGTEFRFTVPKDLLPGAGPFLVRAEYGGSRLYRGSNDARDVQLTSRTTLLLEPADLPRGRPAQLEGSLKDEKARPVAGERVELRLGNDTLEATTAEDGTFAVPVQLPRTHPLGGLVLRARYDGGRNGLLEAAQPTSTVVQVVAATTLSVPPRSVALGPLPVNGTLLDDRGQAVPGAKLEIALGNTTLGFAVTDLQGRFETEVVPREGTPPGTHALRVRFGGSGTLAPTEAAVAYRLLASSRVVIEGAGALVRGEQGLVVANLTDDAGRPLASRALELLLEGTPVGVATTDARGIARLLGKPPGFLERGNATVEVRFAGDDGYIASRATQSLPVVVRTVLEVALPAQVEQGQLFQGAILVRDDAGRPLRGEVVVVEFTGYKVPVALTTDASGRANFTGRMQAPGLAALTVRYPGAEGQASAEERFTVQSVAPVLAGTSLLGLLVLAAAAVVLGSALLAKRFRRVQVSELQRFLTEAEQRLIASTEYQASILWAYRRVVDLMRGQGFLVKESFTPRELLEALAAAMPVGRANLERLVTVFEEARYSPHPIGPAHRDEALTALRGIERDLREAQRQGQLAPPPEVANG